MALELPVDAMEKCRSQLRDSFVVRIDEVGLNGREPLDKRIHSQMGH